MIIKQIPTLAGAYIEEFAEFAWCQDATEFGVEPKLRFEAGLGSEGLAGLSMAGPRFPPRLT